MVGWSDGRAIGQVGLVYTDLPTYPDYLPTQHLYYPIVSYRIEESYYLYCIVLHMYLCICIVQSKDSLVLSYLNCNCITCFRRTPLHRAGDSAWLTPALPCAALPTYSTYLPACKQPAGCRNVTAGVQSTLWRALPLSLSPPLSLLLWCMPACPPAAVTLRMFERASASVLIDEMMMMMMIYTECVSKYVYFFFLIHLITSLVRGYFYLRGCMYSI